VRLRNFHTACATEARRTVDGGAERRAVALAPTWPYYLEAAFSFFFAFFSFTVSLGLLVVLDFSWPLGIVKNSLRKPKWRAPSKYSEWPVPGRVENHARTADRAALLATGAGAEHEERKTTHPPC